MLLTITRNFLKNNYNITKICQEFFVTSLCIVVPHVQNALYFRQKVRALYRTLLCECLQEAQLPQKNSASAAHMEGAMPSSPLPLPSGYTYAYGRTRNPQQTYMYVKRAVRKAHFKFNRAFKVIQGYPYLCLPLSHSAPPLPMFPLEFCGEVKRAGN